MARCGRNVTLQATPLPSTNSSLDDFINFASPTSRNTISLSLDASIEWEHITPKQWETIWQWKDDQGNGEDWATIM